VLHQATSSTVASQLTQMMVDVVANGTGTNAQIPGLSVAGKTGTANSAPSRPPYAWMVTFAPADNPQVAVAVQIEHSSTLRSDITGNGLAGPICRSIMQAVLGQ
jgi:peptidoglycan glycosyltransferase